MLETDKGFNRGRYPHLAKKDPMRNIFNRRKDALPELDILYEPRRGNQIQGSDMLRICEPRFILLQKIFHLITIKCSDHHE
jgi:hypothetical protein